MTMANDTAKDIVIKKYEKTKVEMARFLKYHRYYKKLFKSDIAYLFLPHPVISNFIARVALLPGKRIHFINPGDDTSKYRKIIVPNGRWPEIKAFSDQIPNEKKVYCEVAFFPQNHAVYLDDKGIHGYSSVRDAELPELSGRQKIELEKFRKSYQQQNYVKIAWESVNLPGHSLDKFTAELETNSYIFVPLQLENDTAFDLCPFQSNQEKIRVLEDLLPDEKLVFKMHPCDDNLKYTVKRTSVLLTQNNRNLNWLLSRSKSVISCNSTVVLEALMFGKKCATLGEGFSTNHKVTFECNENLSKLKDFDAWTPNQQKIDRFLHFLIQKQISLDLLKQPAERKKLNYWFKRYQLNPD